MPSRIPWHDKEKAVVIKAFRKYIYKDKLPGKQQCLQLIESNNCLSAGKWQNIKDFVRNEQRKFKHMFSA